MIEAVALAAAYLSGVGVGRLATLALVLFAPLALVPVVIVLVVGQRRRYDDRGARVCDAIAAELRAGSSLGHALASAATSTAIDIGLDDSTNEMAPIEMASRIGSQLPEIADELEATVSAASRAGGSTADLFDEIAALAITHGEIAHEIRVAAAPARVTAWFFVLVPTAFLLIRARSGGLGGVLAAPAQRLTALVGLLLFVVGLAAVGLIMWRALR